MRKQMLHSRDMRGKIPVRSLYKIPVHLSAKAAKQNIFASDDVSFSSIALASVVGKGWTSEIKLLVECLLQRAGMVGIGAATGSGASLRCVLRIPICGHFMCPFTVSGLGLRYFVMPAAIRLGHLLRYPQQMAFKSIEILGLHTDWCAKRMLLALFYTVCMKEALFVGLFAWVLAQSGAANIVMALLSWWVVVCRVPSGRVHRSIVWSLLPIKIMLPLYLTTHVDLLKISLHPTLVKMCMPNKDAMESSGIMCPINGMGRPSMCVSHMCVNDTWRLSASETVRRFVVTLLLITGVPLGKR